MLREVWEEEEGTELGWKEANGMAHPVISCTILVQLSSPQASVFSSVKWG